MGVKDIFLLCYHLVLSLLKPREIRVFWEQKIFFGTNRRNPLNSSSSVCVYIYIYFFRKL